MWPCRSQSSFHHLVVFFSCFLVSASHAGLPASPYETVGLCWPLLLLQTICYSSLARWIQDTGPCLPNATAFTVMPRQLFKILIKLLISQKCCHFSAVPNLFNHLDLASKVKAYFSFTHFRVLSERSFLGYFMVLINKINQNHNVSTASFHTEAWASSRILLMVFLETFLFIYFLTNTGNYYIF